MRAPLSDSVLVPGCRRRSRFTGRAPSCPSDNPQTGAKAITGDEVEAVDDRSVRRGGPPGPPARAGFDGVELRAHGCLIRGSAALRSTGATTSTADRYEAARGFLVGADRRRAAVCGRNPALGVRFVARAVRIQMLEIQHRRRPAARRGDADTLRGHVALGFASSERSAAPAGAVPMSFIHRCAPPRLGDPFGAAGGPARRHDAARVLAAGMDFVVVGRSAVLHHDFARRVAADPAFVPDADTSQTRSICGARA